MRLYSNPGRSVIAACRGKKAEATLARLIDLLLAVISLTSLRFFWPTLNGSVDRTVEPAVTVGESDKEHKMKSPNSGRLSLFAGLAAFTVFTSACYVYTDTPPHHPHVEYGATGVSPYFGDVSLGWAFDDAVSCYAADVTEVQISIEGIDTADGDLVSLPCGADGATLVGFSEGWYWLRVDGFDAFGHLLYTTELEVEILGGMNADVGVLVLEALAPAPPPPPVIEPGSLAIDWAFRYPDVDATYDCAYAGVDWVEINVYDSWGDLSFGETVACTEGPIVVDNFDPGRFDIELRGIGAYQGDYIELYSSPVVIADLYDGSTTDLGVLDLDRQEDRFGDFMLDWSFEGYSCEAQGVTDVTVRVIRVDGQIIDDEFTVPCEERLQLRATFVPGDYEIELTAADVYGDCWYAGGLFDLVPNTMASVDLWAELVSCW